MADPLFASARGRVLRVALPVPIDSLFDYLPPASDDSAAAGDAPWPGRRVLVPFSGRRLTGVVIETTEGSTRAGRLQRAERTLDDAPVVGPALLDALREAAKQALCPIGLALSPALPPGSAPRLVRQLRLTQRGRNALAGGAARGGGRAVRPARAPRAGGPGGRGRRRA
ncbi:MAG: hypothetical protein VX681_00545, partial [Myxococcota bacterium]|nr:hypothetical protein [Myxococcota bacterium]